MPKRRTPEGLTRWEAGQVLIKAHDCLMECAAELNPEYPAFSKDLEVMGLRIGSLFNKFGSHQFGLRDLTELKGQYEPSTQAVECLPMQKEKDNG